jgi:hypothetical protein
MAEKKTAKPEEITAEDVEKDPTLIREFFDHQRKAAESAGKALESIIPTGVRENGSTAFKEMVEGYRQLLNGMLDRVVDNVERFKVDKKEKEDEK